MVNLSSFVFPKLLRFFVGMLAAAASVIHAQSPAEAEPLDAVLALEQATVGAIEKSEHSIVAISRVRRDRQPVLSPDSLKLGSPFVPADSPESSDFIPTFFGSGVIISPDGYILTCAHVLDDPQLNDYFVWLDKASYVASVVSKPAKVLASDPFSDLAVLKIEADHLTPIQFGDAQGLRKGQFVIALGNPEAIARDGQASASWGIISNLKRLAPADEATAVGVKETIHHLGTLIQTDAKLSLGTSGGALINLRGEMVGLTTSLAALSGYEQSAGFAIAVDEMFRRAVETLRLGKLPEYGFLGIQPEDLRPFEREQGIRGAKVVVVIPGLPGEQAGLRPEDIIIEVGQEIIHDRNDLFRELSKAAAGTVVDLRVQRFRAGGRVPEIVTLHAELSKKYVAARRPGYAIHAPPAWRGMVVEYATAISSELARSGVITGRRGAPKLAVLSVEPDTPAWRAGVRPGNGILAVEGQSVSSPDDFRQVLEGRLGPVDLDVVQSNGRGQALTVEPL